METTCKGRGRKVYPAILFTVEFGAPGDNDIVLLG
ncbi:unnamed protein product, partial [Didymodactylos carnosus]